MRPSPARIVLPCLACLVAAGWGLAPALGLAAGDEISCEAFLGMGPDEQKSTLAMVQEEGTGEDAAGTDAAGTEAGAMDDAAAMDAVAACTAHPEMMLDAALRLAD